MKINDFFNDGKKFKGWIMGTSRTTSTEIFFSFRLFLVFCTFICGVHKKHSGEKLFISFE